MIIPRNFGGFNFKGFFSFDKDFEGIYYNPKILRNNPKLLRNKKRRVLPKYRVSEWLFLTAFLAHQGPFKLCDHNL